MEKFDDDFIEEEFVVDSYSKKIKAKGFSNKIALKETIMRLKKSEIYSHENELSPFISLAKKFDETEVALTMIHNCHVIRLNNNHPSSPKRLVAAIEKILNGNYSIKILQFTTELLSQRDSYEINEEEMKEVKQKIEKQKEVAKSKGKRKSKRENKEDDEIDEDEMPSPEELKKIEREFRNILKSGELEDFKDLE